MSSLARVEQHNLGVINDRTVLLIDVFDSSFTPQNILGGDLFIAAILLGSVNLPENVLSAFVKRLLSIGAVYLVSESDYNETKIDALIDRERDCYDAGREKARIGNEGVIMTTSHSDILDAAKFAVWRALPSDPATQIDPPVVLYNFSGRRVSSAVLQSP